MRTKEEVFRRALEAACVACHVDKDWIRQKNRKRKYVDARRMIAAYLWDLGYDMPQIGNFLGCNRSTVFNLLETHRNYLETDAEYRKVWEEYLHCYEAGQKATDELLLAVHLRGWAVENVDRKFESMPRAKWVQLLRYVKSQVEDA